MHKSMHKNVFKILGIVFACVGIALILAGTITFAVTYNRRSRILADSVTVTAEIVEIGRRLDADGNPRYTSYVAYTIDGREIIAPLRYNSSSMFLGQRIDIIVNRQNPTEFMTNSILEWLAPLILFPMSLPFAGIGLGFFIANSRKAKMRKWLFENGTPIWATVVGTDENRSIQVNGRPALVLLATYNNMEFVSDTIDNNDLAHVKDHVKVFLHPENFNKYAFDITNEGWRMPADSPMLQ